MLYSQMFNLLKDAGCSPEEFGERLGVSGMTVRRWAAKSPRKEIPKLYVSAIREACYQLLAEGKLTAELESVRAVLVESNSYQYQAALANLGLTEGFSVTSSSPDGILRGLTRIGSQDCKQTEVDDNHEKVFSFRRLGEEWSSRITFLWGVVRSKKLTMMDKLVAYGALFYLITPIDFIPDQIPFIGLLDDFVVLGVAVAYYAKKYSSVV